MRLSAAVEDTLTPLLNDPKTKLEDVLLHSSLMPSLRRDEPSDALIRYILDQTNLDRLLTYALTNDLISEENFTKVQKASVDVLSTTSRKLQSEFRASSQLIEGLASFPNLPASRDPKLCGNFASIVELITRSTCGTLLSTKMSFLKDFLLNNLDMMGLRELFLRLVTDFSTQFRVTETLLDSICALGKIEGVRGLCAVATIRDILQEKPDLFIHCQNPRILDQLLQIGCEFYPTEPIRSAIAFGVSKQIIVKGHKDTARELVSKRKSPIETNRTINCATGNALSIFPKSAELLFGEFFKFEMPTIVCDAFVSVLEECEESELRAWTVKHHLNEKLMQHFDEFKQRKTNGHYLKVCQLLMNSNLCCCNEHQDQWNQFVTDCVLPQGRMEAAPYGGPLNPRMYSLGAAPSLTLPLYARSANAK